MLYEIYVLRDGCIEQDILCTVKGKELPRVGEYFSQWMQGRGRSPRHYEVVGIERIIHQKDVSKNPDNVPVQKTAVIVRQLDKDKIPKWF